MPVNAVSNCDNTDFALKTAYYLTYILPVLNQFTQPLVVSRTFFAYLISVSKSNIKKNARFWMFKQFSTIVWITKLKDASLFEGKLYKWWVK